jgi:hypothetical protein
VKKDIQAWSITTALILNIVFIAYTKNVLAGLFSFIGFYVAAHYVTQIAAKHKRSATPGLWLPIFLGVVGLGLYALYDYMDRTTR